MSPDEGSSPSTTYTGLRKNRLSLKWKTAPVISTASAVGVHGEQLPADVDAPRSTSFDAQPATPRGGSMTPNLATLEKPQNLIEFCRNGTACVIFYPFTPELTESEWEKIDAARRIRFFVYAGSDAPVPPGQSGVGKFEDYPVASVRSAIDRSTYMCMEILPVQKRSRQGLVKALMDLAAKACSDDHRCALLGVTDRPSLVDDRALYRPHVPFGVASPVRA